MLIACGDAQQEEPSTEKKTVEAPRGPVNDVMNAIAPEDRMDFQNALTCEVKKNAGNAIKIDGKYISDLYQRIKKDPSIFKC